MNKILEYVKTRFTKYQKDFEVSMKDADTLEDMIHAYASYTGKLEALLEALTIEGGK